MLGEAVIEATEQASVNAKGWDSSVITRKSQFTEEQSDREGEREKERDHEKENQRLPQ